jgi:hypothetical protein
MLRFVRSLVVGGVLGLACAPAALAAPPSPANPAGKVLGVVQAHGQASHLGPSGGNLSYHNGPVMHTNSVRAIYWIPAGYSVSSNYRSLIDGYFGNVAADSGKSSNVYFSDTQYYDLNAPIAYSSTFNGSVVDTNAFPANGCRDSYTSVCLSDAQLQAEISRVIAANGWSTGLGTLYFIFTPKNVGSCAGSSCAFSSYCAYHSWIGSGSSATLYANMPYAAYVPAECGSGPSPNGDDADSTINVTSHEHNESVTDPLGSAWFDRRGYEDGDKCGWNFGTPVGGGSGAQYNQQIGTGKYYLQQEWSNQSSGCVLTGV